MRSIDRDSLPHLVDNLFRMANSFYFTLWARLAASWWGVQLGQNCFFIGRARFSRHPRSRISIGAGCRFRSSPASNLIGVNRPCMISTLKENSQIEIGPGCGFSGTVIGCAVQITIGRNVRFGANNLITDTDWHTDDPRSGPDTPVSIGDGVWFGANVTVLKGVKIGENTLVATGSLVTKSLPSSVVAAGVPAKVIRRI